MAAAAAALAVSSSSDINTDGPVLNLINKRIRALRKKLSRISQMEESLSQGKILNKEQEETLRSKSSVLAGIDELEKLRQPLSQAVDQEIQFALEKNNQKPKTLIPDTEEIQEPKVKGENNGVSVVSDLLNLLYFGSVFDVNTLMMGHENMLKRTHERGCCLTYDYVTDDDSSGEPLKEWDLDLISALGSLLISRPMNSSLSHERALQKCVEHANHWLTKSERPIDPTSDVTYADLRERLDKIMTSEYFTTTPQIKAPVEVAAAAGNYTPFESVIPDSENVPIEGLFAKFRKEEEELSKSLGNDNYDDETGPTKELPEGGSERESNTSEGQPQIELGIPDTEVDQNSRDMDLKEQQYAPRRSYQNHRGGHGGGGGGGGRRGYSNGRGGRGSGRGGYQNGRSQFYDQTVNYYPRNNYSYRSRGGMSMSGNYNYHTSHDGHVPAASS